MAGDLRIIERGNLTFILELKEVPGENSFGNICFISEKIPFDLFFRKRNSSIFFVSGLSDRKPQGKRLIFFPKESQL